MASTSVKYTIIDIFKRRGSGRILLNFCKFISNNKHKQKRFALTLRTLNGNLFSS